MPVNSQLIFFKKQEVKKLYKKQFYTGQLVKAVASDTRKY